MAWDLDGTTQYFDCIMPAAIKAAAGGPFTMIAFCELDDAANGTFMCNMSGSSVFQVTEVFTTYNYGTSAGTRTGPNPTAQSPSAVGTPYIVVISKDTGNVSPEYTLIPWVSGAPGTPVSGTITGGGVSLGNGSAPGASGFIRSGQYGTATTERLNGKLIAMAQYTVYKNSTARALLDSWADWLATGSTGAGLAWAMEFTALTTRTDASGNGGDESVRNGTSPYTLVADPAGFFSSSSAVSVSDVPAGYQLRSGYETVSTGVAVADSPAGLRWRSPEGSGVLTGVQAALDPSSGFRFRSGYETVSSGVGISDAPSGLRWRSGYETASLNVTVADAPAGLRWRSGYENISLGGSPVLVADDSPAGYRFRSVGGAAVLGVATADLPYGWRFRSAPESVSTGITVADRPTGWRFRSGYESVSMGRVVADLPSGFRWRSGYETVTGDLPPETPEPTIYATVSRARAVSAVSRARLGGTIEGARITAAVRRFRS